jgi:FKBP-type peptidyl-prolyl cis-trans isomerase (trigger factor)
MKTNFKKLPGSKIELEVVLDQKEFLPYYQAAYERALSNVHLKGFRPGTAPKELAEKAIDKEEVFNDAAHGAIRWSLDEATKDNGWTLIDTPQIEVSDTKDLGITYKATLTIFPEIKLGNYKKIAHKVMGEKKEVQVEPKEVEQTLEWIRNSRKEGDKIPELNDEFAKSLGKFQNVEELKKSVNEGILMEKQMKENDRLRLKMLDEIVKSSEVDLPEVMVKKTYENMNAQLGPVLKAGGKSEEEIKKSLEERARNNVASNLVIYKIAQIERLEPTPEEVGEQGDYNYNYGVIQNNKVFAFLEKQ